jgi:hypothetical protein
MPEPSTTVSTGAATRIRERIWVRLHNHSDAWRAQASGYPWQPPGIWRTRTNRSRRRRYVRSMPLWTATSHPASNPYWRDTVTRCLLDPRIGATLRGRLAAR